MMTSLFFVEMQVPKFLSFLAMNKLFTILLFYTGLISPVLSQNIAEAQAEVPSLPIPRTTPIQLDGRLEEDCWKNATFSRNLITNFPQDTVFATNNTQVALAFDDKFLYVAAICQQKRSTYTVQSYRRDFGPGTSDAFNVIINPFKDGLNGFFFSISPLNVQREGLMDNGNNISFDWDNRWFSAVNNEEERWTLEIAIPFNTLRYNVTAGQNIWHFNFIRTRLDPWEVSTWRYVPRQYSPNNLAFYGEGIWAEAPPKQRVPISLIPYVNGSVAANYLRDSLLNRTDTPTRSLAGIGGDAKIGITPSLNLDLTINPDFSQVEVDRQVVNLSRFNLFFPERRQFFLENRDLFAMFGFPNARPFFSRQIGLADTSQNGSQTYAPIRMLYGARLSGKLNNNWRIGLLNAQTQRVNLSNDNVLPGVNFTVATAQRRVFKRSALSGILVNKQQLLNNLTEAQSARFQPWNRVAGLEFNLFSADNRWEAESYFHRSFSPDPNQRGNSMAQFLGYDTRKFALRGGFNRIDTTYTADAGFVPRPGVQGNFVGGEYRWYPKGRINQFNIAANADMTTDLRLNPTDRELSLSANAFFADQSFLSVGYYQTYTRLFEPFDPTQTGDGDDLPTGDYSYQGITMEGYSSSTYNLQGNFEGSIGEYFNGQFANLSAAVSYRLQPYGVVGISGNYTGVRLPKPYSTENFWLIGPRIELAFTRSLFLSGFFQYNTQFNNFNINSRLQWRFAPVSDLFLVYTDNSYAYGLQDRPVRFFSPKNKTLVLKVVYWLNV
jgi:Domain of unknown function (DUF5916)